jgi:uncharacterized protein (TIGR04255 family)
MGYHNPPITEALFDIQVELPAGIGIVQLEELCGKISDQYPKKRPRRRFEGHFQVKDGQAATTETVDLGVDGFLNWSSDEKQVVQFRLDGFTYSRLKPYNGWENNFPETMKRWATFRSMVKPTLIRRITVRFINSIEIPQKAFDLDEYFVDAPQAPKVDSTTIEQFLNRIVFNVPAKGAKGVITQTIGQTANPTITPIIFDLDVSMAINALIDDTQISKIFENLRNLKNEIFEKSLHEKTKRLFQ